jgi:hypothetical protein
MRLKFLFSTFLFMILLSVFSCTKTTTLNPAFPANSPTPAATATPVGAAGDAYEDDDTYLNAKTITVNGAVQHHTFHDYCDQDYIKFSAVAGTSYTIQTLNLNVAAHVDTVITLYSTDGTTYISENDDYNSPNLESKLTWIAPSTGVYYVLVKNYTCGGYGANFTYDIEVTTP